MKRNVGVIVSHEKIVKYWWSIVCTKGQLVTIVHLNIVLRLHIKISFNHKSEKNHVNIHGHNDKIHKSIQNSNSWWYK
jgi:hypothetical protein